MGGYNDSCTHTYKRIPVKHEPNKCIEAMLAKSENKSTGIINHARLLAYRRLTWSFCLFLSHRRSQVQILQMILAWWPLHPLEVVLVELTGTEKEMNFSQAKSGQAQAGD